MEKRKRPQEFTYNPDGSVRYIASQQATETARTRGGSRIIQGPETQRGERRHPEPKQAPAIKLPWTLQNDKIFFQNAQSIIRKYTGEYYEFQEFYKRFLLHKQKKGLKGQELPSSHASLSGIFGTEDAFTSNLSAEEEIPHLEESIPLFEKFIRTKREEEGKNISRIRRTLPVFGYREKVLEMVRSNQVCIIAAETGAGKSTQVPQYLLEEGLTRIACTQPRRIACISLAQRVKTERMGWPGASSEDVGYQIRFEKSHSSVAKTEKDGEPAPFVGPKLLFLTEGILLRQIRGDPLLKQYDLIIIDEVHERHAMVDFLLGLLKNVLPVRPELKLVLMSATIQAELFSRYFFDAPLISVPGKTFPVTLEYFPPVYGGVESEDVNLINDRMVEERTKLQEELGYAPSIRAPSQKSDGKAFLEILQLIDAKFPANERGHLLIFMSGYEEITKLARTLDTYAEESQKWIILKLHSTLSMKQQDKVFLPSSPGIRKCIISTNIAETSVTLPDIRFIIDSGRVKELEWDPTTRMQRLVEVWISQASAKQRAGRAGRTGPGICWRLYTEREFGALNEYSTAELVRGLSLDQIILQMKAISSLNALDTVDESRDTAFVQPQDLDSSDIPLALTSNKASIGDPRQFDYLQKPSEKYLNQSLQLLRQVGALDDYERITILGNTLSFLPLDVILGKMLIHGRSFGLTDWSMLMSAGLSVSSPFLREDGKTLEQLNFSSQYGGQDVSAYDWKKEKEKIEMAEGDPFTLIRLIQEWLTIQKTRRMPSKKWCSKLAVEEQRLYEMMKLVQQFKSIIGSTYEDVEDSQPREGKRFKSSQQVENYEKWQKEKHSIKNTEEKTLKAGDAEEEEDFNSPDLFSLEFHARHHIEDLYDEFARIPFFKISAAEKIMLQLVLCSGLYPNIAIPDEGNSTRRVSDHVYHTKFKKFVLLHPSSIYSKHPEWVPSLKSSNSYVDSRMTGTSSSKFLTQLSLADDGSIDIVNVGEMASRFDKESSENFDPEVQSAANYPSFLCYVQLMETTKPYLMSVFSVPALLSAVLFGHSIDTNTDFSVIVIDDWIVIELKSLRRYAGTDKESPFTKAGTEMLVRLLRFREEFHRRVRNTLIAKFAKGFHRERFLRDESGPAKLTFEQREFMTDSFDTLQKRLIADFETLPARAERHSSEFMKHLESILKLDSFIHDMGVHYEIDTVKEEDMKTLFDVKISAEDVPSCLKIEPKWSHERAKVGIKVSSYLTLGSVHYPESMLQRSDKPLEEIQDSIEVKMTPHLSIGTRRSIKSTWECPKCKKAMMITEEEKEAHLVFCPGPQILETQEESQLDSKAPPKIPISTFQITKTKDLSSTSTGGDKCPKCGKSLKMTPIEKLKHKQTCGKY